MARATFLLLTLTLFLLHLAQATTCQGDNCPTGNLYLEFNQKKTIFNLIEFTQTQLISSMKILYLAGLIVTGGSKTETSIETFPAEADCSIPSFPAPGNLSSFFYFSSQGRKEHSLSVIFKGFHYY